MVFISRLLAILFLVYIPYSLFSSGSIDAIIFVHLQSLFLVLFGTIGATLLAYDLNSLRKAFLLSFNALFNEKNDKTKKNEIKQIIDIAKKVQETNGLACVDEILEDKSRKLSTFLRYGLELLISNYTENKFKDMLSNYANELNFQKIKLESIMHNMTITAPAFGMIGTVMGLIIMLTNLDMDANNIGVGLAFALLTTLYGVVLSNLLFRPANVYINEQRYAEQHFIEALTVGLLQIKVRAEPVIVQDYLNSYLPVKSQIKIDE